MYKVQNYAVKAVVDIATLAADGKTGVKIPQGLVVIGAALKETTKATGGTSPTATVKYGSTAIGSAVTIGGGTAADVYGAGTAAKMSADTDLVVTLGGTANATAGVLEVTVVGFFVDGLPYVDEPTVADNENKAPADPYKA